MDDDAGTPSSSRTGERPLVPLIARSRTIYHRVDPVAYDCVKVIIVRDGTAIVFSEFGQKPVRPGDVVLLAANTLCASEPEGHVTVTSVSLDPDYLLDQVRWQFAGVLRDRLDAQGFADAIYTEPAQILRLGEDRAGMLTPWLDELVALSIERQFSRLLPDSGTLVLHHACNRSVHQGFSGTGFVLTACAYPAHAAEGPTLRPVARRGPPCCRAAARSTSTPMDTGGSSRTGAPVVVAARSRICRGVWEDATGVPDDGASRASRPILARDRYVRRYGDAGGRLALPQPRDRAVPPIRRAHSWSIPAEARTNLTLCPFWPCYVPVIRIVAALEPFEADSSGSPVETRRAHFWPGGRSLVPSSAS